MGADLVVGISPLGHDLSVTIARPDGGVALVAEEERYSRVKGGEFVFHPSRLEHVLAEAGFGLSDVAIVAPAGMPASSLQDERVSILYPPAARQRHMQAWMREYRRLLPDADHRPAIRHHRAHATSTYYPSPFNEATVVTLDGHGDGECCTISVASGTRIRLLERQTAPDSVCYLFRAVASYLGFRGHEREGKLMALAAYGEPVLVQALSDLFFERSAYPARATSRIRALPCREDAWGTVLVETFGPGRSPGSTLNGLHLDLAASAQHLFTAYMLSVIERAHQLTGSRACCAAGGAFVNSVANGHVCRESPFRDLFFPAWASDVGLSIGAAATVLAEGKIRLRLSNAYAGSDLDLSSVPALATELDLSCQALDDPTMTAANLVARGRIVGWAQNRLEVGPRALGNRSILAHPGLAHMRHELNRRKHREPWRPFGASILVEDADGGTRMRTESPFMNVTFGGLDASTLSAVLHVDGSCRVHTVCSETNPLFAKLLGQMKDRTGTAAVINTSLNGPGKPIARTVSECLQTYLDLELDALVIGGYLIAGRFPRRDARLVEALEIPTLQEPFDLLLPYPGDDSALLRCLREKATRTAIRTDLLRPRQTAGDADLDSPPLGPNVVIYNPWHNSVFYDMLPRVAAWALRRCAAGGRILVVDCCGDTDALARRPSCSPEELESVAATDVEGHLLRKLARSRTSQRGGPLRGDPWFPQAD